MSKHKNKIVIAICLVTGLIGAIAASIFLSTGNQPEAKEATTTPSTQHTHTYLTETVSATCTRGGYTLHTCDCGDFYKADESNLLQHEYGNWEVVRAATADGEGEKEQYCLHCNARNTASIPKVEEHKHVYKDQVVAPTCTKAGYTRHTCSCGNLYDDSNVPATGHLYGDWETTVAPTTESAGEKQCTCSQCSNILTESIPALEKPSGTAQGGSIDPRIEITSNGRGAESYFYSSVGLVDTRSWGSPPSISITSDGGFQISYFKADGSKVSVSISPVAGYVNRCVILEDGSYTTNLIGDYSD